SIVGKKMSKASWPVWIFPIAPSMLLNVVISGVQSYLAQNSPTTCFQMYWSQLKILSVAPFSGWRPDAIGSPFIGWVTGLSGRGMGIWVTWLPFPGWVVGFVQAAMIAARLGRPTAAPADRRRKSRLLSS